MSDIHVASPDDAANRFVYHPQAGGGGIIIIRDPVVTVAALKDLAEALQRLVDSVEIQS